MKTDKENTEKNTAQTGNGDGRHDEVRSLLAKTIMEQATEDENPQSASFTLRKILGGDFLTADIFRKQVWLILLITAFTMLYVSNRYSCQKDMLEINRLESDLQDARYKALASSSELTELCRESNVLKMLKNNEDSVLHIANQPPYIINVPENE